MRPGLITSAQMCFVVRSLWPSRASHATKELFLSPAAAQTDATRLKCAPADWTSARWLVGKWKDYLTRSA